jgi:hypothetical protein
MFRNSRPSRSGPHRFKDIFQDLPQESQELIRARYGETRKSGWKFLALLLIAIGLPWLVWSAWFHSNPETRITLVSFKPIDERSIEITFEIDRKSPDNAYICTLIARDYEKNVVGEIDMPIAPNPTNPVQITSAIPTRLAAVNAGVLGCRPTER